MNNGTGGGMVDARQRRKEYAGGFGLTYCAPFEIRENANAPSIGNAMTRNVEETNRDKPKDRAGSSPALFPT